MNKHQTGINSLTMQYMANVTSVNIQYQVNRNSLNRYNLNITSGEHKN